MKKTRSAKKPLSRIVLAAALSLLGNSAAFAAELPKLRFSISESWSMPLAHVDGDKTDDGFLYELIMSLSRQVDREAEFKVMPRTRLQEALEHGEVDVRCYVAKAWLPEPVKNDEYLWSVPLFTQIDVLAGLMGDRQVANIEALSKQAIGTVHGYSYPPLEPYFEAQKLQRDDGRSQDQVLRKLVAKRYRYAMTNLWSLDWFNRGQPESRRITAGVTVESEPLACIVRQAPEVPTQAILMTLEKMRNSGEIDAIVKRYR